MAERILERGEGGAGGWLESACKGILTFRTGILLITVVALWGEDGDRALPAAAIVVAAIASAIPLRYWDRVGPALVRHPGYLAGELVLATLILLLTGVNSPFFYYTLGTALLGGIVYGWAGGGLFSVMLIGVYAWAVVGARRRRRGDSRAAGAVPADRRRGRGLRGLLDRQAETESELAPCPQSERARLARDMHDSLAKTVLGHGLRGARARAPHRARPRDGRRRGAQAGRGRPPGHPRGARDHRRPARRRGRAAAADGRSAGGGAGLGGGERRARRARRGRGRRAASRGRARARVDHARGAAQRRAPRRREPGHGAAAPARRPRRAHRRRRRRRLRGARRARGARPRPPLRRHRDARARAARGRRPERRVRARRRLRAVGLDAGRGGARGTAPVAAPQQPPPAPPQQPPPAAPTDTLPTRSVPGYTWR